MSRSDLERVQDVLSACEEALEIVSRGRERFNRNSETRRAAERLIHIIGEASGAVSPGLAQAHPDIPFNDAKSMRNFLSHEYWRSDPDTVWDTIAHDVPMLVSQLQPVRDALQPPAGSELPEDGTGTDAPRPPNNSNDSADALRAPP